jgi:hypothetical protein
MVYYWRTRTPKYSGNTTKGVSEHSIRKKLVVHTDHQHILYGKMSTDRIIRWRLLIEENGPAFCHIKGEKNIVADALSRMEADFSIEYDNQPTAYTMARSYVNKEEIKQTNFPMSPSVVKEHQKKDKSLQWTVILGHSKKYSTMIIEDQ